MTLSEKTRIPLGLAAALVVFLVPAFGLYQRTAVAQEATKERVVKLEAHLIGQEKAFSDLQRDVAVLKTGVEFQTQLLRELKAELKLQRRSQR